MTHATHISEFKDITIYEGYTEMILQEDWKNHSAGKYSDLVYVKTQDQYYVFGEYTFVKIDVEES